MIVTPGSYTLDEAAFTEYGVDDVDVHGELGGPMPRITGSVEAWMIGFRGMGSSIRYVDIVNSRPESPIAILCGSGDRVERVRASAVGANATGITQVEDCLVRDTLARADGSKSAARGAPATRPV